VERDYILLRKGDTNKNQMKADRSSLFSYVRLRDRGHRGLFFFYKKHISVSVQ
jgi:hypothetical protein